MSQFQKVCLRAAGAVFAAALGGLAHGQAYPEREVSLTVNYGAGGNTDVVARALVQSMEKSLGKPVVVLNRAGALGTLGVAYLARQKPDGYNIGVVTYATTAIMPHLMDLTYKIDDFDFIAGFGRYRYGIAVLADSPYKRVQDLITAGKTGPGLFFGATSAPNNLAMFELARLTGAKFEQVPYKSGAETVAALLGGQVAVIVQNPSDIMPHVKSGRVRLLASASPMRWVEQPDVPTLREAGYAVEIDSWLGLAAPRGTPPDVVRKLEAVTLAAIKDPVVSAKVAQFGVDPTALTGKEYEDVLRKGYVVMGQAIKAANLPRMTP